MEEVSQQGGQQFFIDLSTRVREAEERQQLMRDRMLLLGKGVIDLKDKMLAEMRDVKKAVAVLQKENESLKETISMMAEKLNSSARQEEVAMLKRQIDLLRGVKNGNS